jgi:hypothetical protein
MVAKFNRSLERGKKFDKLIPLPDFKTITVSKNTNISETVDWILQIVYITLSQTQAIAPLLVGRNLRETCQNIWNFVYQHIQYREDEKGKEQLHTPARTWAKRKYGVDCDDYTILMASILLNLKIPHKLRLAEYNYKGFYQHIYVIVPLGNGTYLTLDPVKDNFNEEHPYTNFEDIDMELQVLSGFGDTEDVDLFYDDGKGNVYVDKEFAQNNAQWLLEQMNIKEIKDIPKDTAERTWAEWAKQNKWGLIGGGIGVFVVGLVALSFIAESEAEAKEKERANKKQEKDKLQGVPAGGGYKGTNSTKHVGKIKNTLT